MPKDEVPVLGRLSPSAHERQRASLEQASASHASSVLRRDGVLLLEQIIDPALIEQTRQEFHVDTPRT